MTLHLMILEPDEALAARLAHQLAELHGAETSIAPNTREACLQLLQKRYDIAFIPRVKEDRIVRALRNVQPDLRLVLMLTSASSEVPDSYADTVQGTMLKSQPDTDLSAVIDNAMSQPVQLETKVRDATGVPILDTAMIISALQQARVGPLVKSALFAKGSKMLAHWGELSGSQAGTVAAQIGEAWNSEAPAVRIQFTSRFPDSGDMLLYTRCLEDDYLLTIVSSPETPMGELRDQSELIAAGLFDILAGRKMVSDVVAADVPDSDAEGKSFAIAWRPVEPIPVSLYIPLRRALARLAAANACTLIHISVQSELIHMVVSCPPGRDSIWAAYLFKNGSEATIQQEFSVEASLWDTGYYAIESNVPLSDAELSIFVEHEVRE